MLGGNLRLDGGIAIGVLSTYSRPIGVKGGTRRMIFECFNGKAEFCS